MFNYPIFEDEKIVNSFSQTIKQFGESELRKDLKIK